VSDVLLAAIHNGELQSAPAWELIDALGADFEVQEVFDQPRIASKVDRAALDAWAKRQWELESQWRKYLGQDSWLRNAQGTLGEGFWRVRMSLDRRARSEAWRSRQIEAFVSAKHAVAWRALLDGPNQILLVLESDASLIPHTEDGVARILSRIDVTKPVYVNLAGGLDPADLGLKVFQVSSDDGGILYDRAVSNTSCAYLVTRPMVELILNYLESVPEDVELGIDWIFNAVFLAASDVSESIQCFHAEPPVIGHGSRTGVTQSWHPKR
jgi:hypothetical protein